MFWKWFNDAFEKIRCWLEWREYRPKDVGPAAGQTPTGCIDADAPHKKKPSRMDIMDIDSDVAD